MTVASLGLLVALGSCSDSPTEPDPLEWELTADFSVDFPGGDALDAFEAKGSLRAKLY